MMCTKIHEGRSVCISSMTNQPADGTLCGQNKVIKAKWVNLKDFCQLI